MVNIHEHFMFYFLCQMSPMFQCYHHRKYFYFRWCNLFQLWSFFLNNNPKVSLVEKPLLLLFCLKHLFAILFIFLGYLLPVVCWWQNVFSILPILTFDLVPIQIFCFFAKKLSLMMFIQRILVSCFGKIP